MFARFEPADSTTSLAEKPVVHPFTRPLSIVTVTDDAMQPALAAGQQVYVSRFDARQKPNYLEQVHAVRRNGRVLVRRLQIVPGGSIRLIPNQGSSELVSPLDEWERPADWKETGRLLPSLKALGPLVTGRAPGGETCYATAEWSN